MSETVPGPLLRRGPRPLMLHLTLAMLKSSASLGVSPSSSGASPIWSAAAAEQVRLIADALHDQGGATPQALLLEALRQDRELIAGIAAYRRHPWRRDLPEPPAIWREGGSRVLDFGGEGPPMLLVPSLVNRAHVLDLAEGRSMCRWFAANGVRVLLLDWGWPGPVERAFTLTDYIAGRLERALVAIGETLILAGYCMGGLLTVAAALRRPDHVRALALLATPWDFHAVDRERATALARLVPLLEPALGFAKAMPVDALQLMFAMLEPYGIATKYRSFGRLDPDTDRAKLFVALEDWLNDGVPLAAPVARECLAGWYGANAPMCGQWRVAGLPVNPGRFAHPHDGCRSRA